MAADLLGRECQGLAAAAGATAEVPEGAASRRRRPPPNPPASSARAPRLCPARLPRLPRLRRRAGRAAEGVSLLHFWSVLTLSATLFSLLRRKKKKK